MENSVFKELKMNDLMDSGTESMFNFESSLQNYQNILEKMKQSQALEFNTSAKSIFENKLQESTYIQTQQIENNSIKLKDSSPQIKEFNLQQKEQQKEYNSQLKESKPRVECSHTQQIINQNFTACPINFEQFFASFLDDYKCFSLFKKYPQEIIDMAKQKLQNLIEIDQLVDLQKLNLLLNKQNLISLLKDLLEQSQSEFKLQQQSQINSIIVDEISELKKILNQKQIQLNSKQQQFDLREKQFNQHRIKCFQDLQKKNDDLIQQLNNIYKQKNQEFQKNASQIERNFKSKIQLIDNKLKSVKSNQKSDTENLQKIKQKFQQSEKNNEFLKQKINDLEKKLQVQITMNSQQQQKIEMYKEQVKAVNEVDQTIDIIQTQEWEVEVYQDLIISIMEIQQNQNDEDIAQQTFKKSLEVLPFINQNIKESLKNALINANYKSIINLFKNDQKLDFFFYPKNPYFNKKPMSQENLLNIYLQYQEGLIGKQKNIKNNKSIYLTNSKQEEKKINQLSVQQKENFLRVSIIVLLLSNDNQDYINSIEIISQTLEIDESNEIKDDLVQISFVQQCFKIIKDINSSFINILLDFAQSGQHQTKYFQILKEYLNKILNMTRKTNVQQLQNLSIVLQRLSQFQELQLTDDQITWINELIKKNDQEFLINNLNSFLMNLE